MELSDVFKEKDAYVMCSTLNQIVNYIPIKKMEEKFKNDGIKIFSITVESDTESNSIFKRFDNKKWNENLETVLAKINNSNIKVNYIPISRNNPVDAIEEIFEDKETNTEQIDYCPKKLCKNQNSNSDAKLNFDKKKIVWNITGGQRSTVFAILNFIVNNNRCDDRIIYLEGNTNKVICGQFNKNARKINYCELERYGVDNLELNTVFNLAGFIVRNNETNYNYLDDEVKLKKELGDEFSQYELCKKYFEYYKGGNYNQKKDFLKALVYLDKDGGNSDDKVKKFITDLIRIFKNNFDKKSDYELAADEKILIGMKGDSGKKAGYILEYMTLASVIDVIKVSELKNYIVGVYHSVNVDSNSTAYDDKNTQELCEFDVVILSKSGQVVVLECKAGTMKSDVGKARQYTAYAVGGVYGKPILITPLLISNKSIYDELKSDKDFDNIREAMRAAARANMEVWGLDEIKKKIKELYNEALGSEKNE